MSDPVAEAAEQLAAMQNTGAGDPQMVSVPAPGALATILEADALGNAPAVAEASVTAPATAEAAELPNVASGAAEPTTEPDSAPSADGANTTSPIDASSVEPLHVRVAAHLEAIFQMVKTDAERAPTDAESYAEHVKNHVESVLHHIYNGMQVSEGELVRKLEALYRML